MQVGCLRAGWYAGDLLDDLARPGAGRIIPALQDLEVGRWLPMAPKPTETMAFVVDSFEQPRWMLWRTPTSTWAWRLVLLPDGRTRLVTRLRTAYDRRHPSGILLMELGDWPMIRRMLRGIRRRAETEHRRRTPPPAQPRRLAVIKTVHTAAWASIEACVGYLLWSGIRGRSDRRAAAAAAVVTGECLVFAADGFRCPDDGTCGACRRHQRLGYRHLPTWFAQNLPAIHLPLLALIGWPHRRALHLGRWPA